MSLPLLSRIRNAIRLPDHSGLVPKSTLAGVSRT